MKRKECFPFHYTKCNFRRKCHFIYKQWSLLKHISIFQILSFFFTLLCVSSRIEIFTKNVCILFLSIRSLNCRPLVWGSVCVRVSILLHVFTVKESSQAPSLSQPQMRTAVWSMWLRWSQKSVANTHHSKSVQRPWQIVCFLFSVFWTGKTTEPNSDL